MSYTLNTMWQTRMLSFSDTLAHSERAMRIILVHIVLKRLELYIGLSVGFSFWILSFSIDMTCKNVVYYFVLAREEKTEP